MKWGIRKFRNRLPFRVCVYKCGLFGLELCRITISVWQSCFLCVVYFDVLSCVELRERSWFWLSRCRVTLFMYVCETQSWWSCLCRFWSHYTWVYCGEAPQWGFRLCCQRKRHIHIETRWSSLVFEPFRIIIIVIGYTRGFFPILVFFIDMWSC